MGRPRGGPTPAHPASEPQPVVVTGLGAVSPVGAGRETFWSGLLSGRSGISPVRSFDTTAYRVKNGAEIHGFPGAGAGRPQDRRGRASKLAIAAAHEALADAGIELAAAGGGSAAAFAPERAGVAMGTTSGEPREVERFDDLYLAEELDRLGPEFIGLYPSHVIAGAVAEAVGFSGVHAMIPAACAAGNYAVGYALDALRWGRADVMLAGGADAFSRITYTGFARLGAVAPEVCRPFDRNREGMIPGEGAAVLVLERLDSARRRGATVYAEVAGYGLACDAHHMTAAHPQGDGLARAMRRALRGGGEAPEAVDYISAHGTGTPTNDKLETRAMESVFGEHLAATPVSSVKSMIGHTMGAASAFESAVCCLAIAEGVVPPTINFEQADPECAVDCVPNQAREMPVRVALNNAAAFGGNNATVLFREAA